MNKNQVNEALLTCFLDFFTIGCGFSSSSENGLVLGSKSLLEDANDNAARKQKKKKVPLTFFVPKFHIVFRIALSV